MANLDKVPLEDGRTPPIGFVAFLQFWICIGHSFWETIQFCNVWGCFAIIGLIGRVLWPRQFSDGGAGSLTAQIIQCKYKKMKIQKNANTKTKSKCNCKTKNIANKIPIHFQYNYIAKKLKHKTFLSIISVSNTNLIIFLF